jgi:hypothetical protein
MPFDSAKLGDRVTIVPPTPPERGDGPRRIRLDIHIHLVDRRTSLAPSRAVSRPIRGVGALLAILLLLAMALHL